MFDIIDVPEPEKMSANERSAARTAIEDEYFSEDHYMFVPLIIDLFVMYTISLMIINQKNTILLLTCI